MLKKIGNYVLKEKIDENEFKICYKANDINNKLYLIKEINIQNKDLVYSELQILNEMNSKYSIEFIELINNNDYIYMVLELCDGNLNNLLNKKNRNGNCEVTTLIKIIFQFNEVLKLMHSKQIVHRNLKPENILIKNKNDIHIKLSDYTLTKYYVNNNNSNFKNNINIYYQAPEVSQNKNITFKSNLWSIGLILYYLYFNQLPFIDKDDYFNLNNKIILKKTHFKLLDDLISKLLIKNPKERIIGKIILIIPLINNK